MANIYKHGVPEQVLDSISLSTHDWSAPETWANDDSAYEIAPDAGQIMVLRECLVKFTAGVTFNESNKLIIEALINTPGAPVVIPITEYVSVKDFMKRSDKTTVVDLGTNVGDVTRPIVETRLYFTQQVILWSTGGYATEGSIVDIGGVTVAADRLGLPKFNKLVARIANDSPFTMADGSTVEIAMCRYFLTKHDDPDV